jgi:hypothetical protein
LLCQQILCARTSGGKGCINGWVGLRWPTGSSFTSLITRKDATILEPKQ